MIPNSGTHTANSGRTSRRLWRNQRSAPDGGTRGSRGPPRGGKEAAPAQRPVGEQAGEQRLAPGEERVGRVVQRDVPPLAGREASGRIDEAAGPVHVARGREDLPGQARGEGVAGER